MSEFFTTAESRPSKSLTVLAARCFNCGLYKTCKNPKIPVEGKGKKGVLIVGEYPGREESWANRHFVGGAGHLLRKSIEDLGFSASKDCWLTNAAICYGAHQHKTAVEDCRPNLLKLIEELQPTAVLLLGGAAVKSLIGYVWKDSKVDKIGPWVGWQIPCRRPNCWIVPNYNPAYVLRNKQDLALKNEFKRVLALAFEKAERPWDTIPDDAGQCDVTYDQNQAVHRLQQIQSGHLAWDIETTALKPDSSQSQIVCASVCEAGKRSFAFPWTTATESEMKRILQSEDIHKIGYNNVFETRWVRRKLGFRVRGWFWDGMLAAHALDSRAGITGLKFQSFVRLGAPDYSSHIEPYFEGKGKGGYVVNRVREIKPKDLMLYCAIDSYLELQVAAHQMREMGLLIPWE